jgi:hypothetical protein
MSIPTAIPKNSNERGAQTSEAPFAPHQGVFMENLSPNRGDLTPPMMASERLLDPSDTQTQFASYHGDTDPKGQQWDVPESGSHSLHEHIAAEWRGVQL